MTTELDRIDINILKVLSQDGRITLSALAKKVGLSKTPVQQRIRALEKAGIITGYQAKIDPIQLGLDHIAFVQIKLSDTRELALRDFNAAASRIPELEELHLIAGSFDYLLKIRCRDINSYRKILAEKISSLPHIAHSSTYMAIEAVKEKGKLAI